MKAQMTEPDISLAQMADDMQVSLYRRYSEKEAAGILGVSEQEMTKLRTSGAVAYLKISDNAIGYFGCQLLTYLRQCIVPAGEAEPETTTELPAAEKTPKAHPDALFYSVEQAYTALGISRAKLYQLFNAGEISTKKIGRRTLVEKASLEAYAGRKT